MTEITYHERQVPSRAELVTLYESVGWSAYTKAPAALERGLRNSTYVVTARLDGRLVGLARGLSDGETVFYLQDILVNPGQQRGGVGRGLLRRCLDAYCHVRQVILLTDDEERQRLFYQSMGFTNLREFDRWPLNAYVIMR